MLFLTKSELGKSNKYTLRAKTNKDWAASLTNREKSVTRVHVCFCHFFSRDMTTNFGRNGYFKNRLICDCAGEHTRAIEILLPTSLLS